MQEKGYLADTSELGKASFRVAPKAFYAIDMATLIGKLIVSVVDPEMLLVPYIHQAVIASIHSLDKISGIVTIMSSNCCSVSNFEIGSGIGLLDTFQIAYLFGIYQHSSLEVICLG